MYKKRPSKRQKMIFNTLAHTRKVLLLLSRELKEIWNTETPFFDYYHFARRKHEGLADDKRFWEAAQTRRALNQLKRKRFIEIRKKGDQISYVLTDKGKMAAYKDRIRITEECSDGRVCVVSFDIPEQERRVRGQIRYQLKDFGFKKEQQSLWVCKRLVGPLLASLVKEWGAERWVRVYEAKPSQALRKTD